MSPWKLMMLPFLECLVLVGIHSYLGIHVIKRKVIFVDLALAQIAALGTIVAFLFGIHPQTPGAYVFSLLFTFIGAAVFSLTRLRDERIPQEAVIGLVYALAAAVAILIIDRAPHGAEHIKEVLTGSILWVKWQTVAIAAVVYAAVGAFHYVFRERFLLISNDPDEAYRRGINVRLWDFLFYMSFGLVITLSVNTAGVLLVFVFLVVPAIMAISITDRLIHQLLIGWGVGTLVSFVGLVASYTFDFPSGPMVVSVYGAALLLVALALFVIRSSRPGVAAGYVAAGIAATAVITIAFYMMGGFLSPADCGHDHDCKGETHSLGHGPEAQGKDHDDHHHADATPEASLIDKLSDVDLTQRSGILNGVTDAAIINKAITATDDEELRVAMAMRLLTLDPSSGRAVLLEIMKGGEIPLFRHEAMSALVKSSGADFGYVPMDEPDSPNNLEALAKWNAWSSGQ